jgi:uncharacterized HAD superfamily protein
MAKTFVAEIDHTMHADTRIARMVVVDIDHTLADAFWRDPLLGKWEEYYAESMSDQPIAHVAAIVRAMSHEGREIVAVTARPESTRALTMRWMVQHRIPIDAILMRANDDYRSSVEVKRDLVVNLGLTNIEFAIEDRDDCVAAYRQLGLSVVQVFHRSREATSDGKDGC